MATHIDISKLDAQTLARHLANPEGDVGIAVSANLNKTNAGPYRLARAKVALQPGERILEVGFGNGGEIAALLDGMPGARFDGIESSATMVEEATLRNAAAIREGRIVLQHGSSSALPFPTETFDKALAINTIYFWAEPAIDLAELRRVVKRSGRLVLGAIAPWSTDRPVFKFGFRFYGIDDLTGLLNSCGFPYVAIETLTEEFTAPGGDKLIRDYFVVSAS